MANDELTIERLPESDGGAVVFRLKGSLDVATSPRLKTTLAEVVAEGHRSVIVDLTPVEFLDSTGLGALIGAHRRTAEKGNRLVLIVGEGPISRLLAITGLSRVFAIYPSLREAFAGIGVVE